MKKKNLCVLPKQIADVVNIDKIRPIMLIEVLRKLWLKPLMNKIRTVWQEYKILQSEQLGYLAQLSTENGLIQLINVLEYTHQSNSDLFFCSFDITKAFDSVQRPFVELALQRLGVPQKNSNVSCYDGYRG